MAAMPLHHGILRLLCWGCPPARPQPAPVLLLQASHRRVRLPAWRLLQTLACTLLLPYCWRAGRRLQPALQQRARPAGAAAAAAHCRRWAACMAAAWPGWQCLLERRSLTRWAHRCAASRTLAGRWPAPAGGAAGGSAAPVPCACIAAGWQGGQRQLLIRSCRCCGKQEPMLQEVVPRRFEVKQQAIGMSHHPKHTWPPRPSCCW